MSKTLEHLYFHNQAHMQAKAVICASYDWSHNTASTNLLKMICSSINSFIPVKYKIQKIDGTPQLLYGNACIGKKVSHLNKYVEDTAESNNECTVTLLIYFTTTCPFTSPKIHCPFPFSQLKRNAFGMDGQHHVNWQLKWLSIYKSYPNAKLDHFRLHHIYLSCGVSSCLSDT